MVYIASRKIMYPAFDIFRYDEQDKPAWIHACDSMVEAKAFMQKDCAGKTVKYMVYDQDTGTKTPVKFD